MSSTSVAPQRQKVASLGYGLGSIWQRTAADGSVTFSHLYRDEASKQREVVLSATTLSAARKEASSRNTRKDEGRLAAPTTITFGKVAEEFLAVQEGLLSEGQRSSRTIDLYRQRYEAHLRPTLGTKKFQTITPSQVGQLLDSLRTKKGKRGNLTSSTRNGILRLAGAIFSFGVSRGYRTDSPIRYLAAQEKPQAKPSTKARALTDDECSALIAATRPGLRDFVTTLAFTGLRLSEALGLRWSDVDLETGVLTVSGQLDRWKDGEAPKLKTLKTENGYRTVDLHPALVTLLKKRRQDALSKGQHGADSFVFCTVDGRPLAHRNTGRDLEAAGDRAGLNGEGLRRVSAHMLRHTFASRLIALGLDVVEVARQLGDKPDTLLRVYAQAFTDARRRDEVKTKIASGTHIAI